MPRFDGEVFLLGTAMVLLRSVKWPPPPSDKGQAWRPNFKKVACLYTNVGGLASAALNYFCP
jgi:hypothetical protein